MFQDKLKILFLLTQDLESPSGVGRYYPLARGLVQLGHKVSIAALHANFNSLEHTHLVKEGIEVNYVAQMHVLKKNNLKQYFPAYKLIGITMHATRELLKAAWNSDANIIHIGKPHPMNSIAGLIPRYLRCKLVFLDCDDYEMVNLHFGSRWQKIAVRFFEDMTPKHVDFVSVHSTFLQKRLVNLGVNPKKLVYIPNGADQVRFANVDLTRVEGLRNQLNLAGKIAIVFIGSLSLPSHPVDILLEAFQQVHTAKPESILLIVGGGEEFERLVAKARWLGLENSVIFIGRVPGDEVPLYYKLANISVEPVIDNLVGRSMMPLKMFESWVAGVPFITQDAGDRRMLLGNPPAGVLTKPGDVNELAEAILNVIANPDIALQLREYGFRQARIYSWDNLSKQMEKAYLNAF